jgi:hypothetical protein
MPSTSRHHGPLPRGSRPRPTRAPRRRERPGGNPVFQNIGAVSAAKESVRCSVAGRWTDAKPSWGVYVPNACLSVIASPPPAGAGDGLQPQAHLSHAIRRVDPGGRGPGAPDEHRCLSAGRLHDRCCWWWRAVSYQAIAAALALEDVSAGERLVAFSLASYASREHQAWPGNPAAAARAGLSRSRYLYSREQLARRGLIAVQEAGGGRGRSTTVALRFAETGPWVDGPVNPALFEAVLGYSRARGPARLLLAAIAAIADENGELAGVATAQISAAAGLADSSYRRARAQLLESGELVLRDAGGGRGNTNYWRIRDPRTGASAPPRARVAPPTTARPLLGAVPAHITAATAGEQVNGLLAAAARDAAIWHVEASAAVPDGAEGRSGPDGLAGEKGPVLNGVSDPKGPVLNGVSGVNPVHNGTVFPQTPPGTPPGTPPETPPANARAGREPQNQEPKDPPCPPSGGSRAATITIVENYVSERGRNRQRPVAVDLDQVRMQFSEPSPKDCSDWLGIRSELRRVAGESVFEIWCAPLKLLAVDRAGVLLLSSPPATRAWVAPRYGRLFERSARSAGRVLRVADDRELQLIDAITAARATANPPMADPDRQTHNQEAI